jgi:hypothetical protein
MYGWLMVNMPMGSNKNELKIVKIIKCNISNFSELNISFSY